MPGYGAGQFDDSDNNAIERRLQEDFRARQQANAAGRVPASLAFNPRATDQAFMSSLMANDAASSSNPYYARQAAAAAPNPYYARPGTMSQQAAAYSASDAVAASLYAHQRAAQYGYATASAANAAAAERAYAYTTVPGTHDLYSQHFAVGRTAQEMSLIDRAAAYNAQQRQVEQQTLMQKSVAANAPNANPGQSIAYAHKPAVQASPAAKQSPRAQPVSSTPKGTPRPAAATKSAETTPSAKKTVTPTKTPTKQKSTATPTASPSSKKGKDMPPDGQKWFSGCVPLGLEDDKYWLSELQVYLRSNFAEAFGATQEDIAAPMHGRNKPIALGQVGIRCMHCKHENPAERGQQATSYPSLISGIYNSVQQMLRLHLDCCQSMPPEVRQKIEQLKLSSSSRGGRKQYWIDSARRLGLVDTMHGIHFGRDPHGPLPPLSGPSVNSKEGRRRKDMSAKEAAAVSAATAATATTAAADTSNPSTPQSAAAASSGDSKLLEPVIPIPQIEERPLVFPEDKPLISDYLYLTLEQMSPCVLMEADRVGCYKTRKVGFPGLACRHCVGQAGCGRYFPASEASLSQTTTSQTIMNHVRNCRRCPIEIRENLEIMKRARMGPDGKRADKPKHGGRKVFFHRLWCRIQGIPMEDGKGETKEKKKRKAKSPVKKTPKKTPQAENNPADVSRTENKEQPEVPTVTRSGSSDNGSGTDGSSTDTSDDEVDGKARTKSSSPSSSSSSKAPKGTKQAHSWHDGCVRLTKTDDVHWLSEVQCFTRRELVEVFSYSQSNTIYGYNGRKDPVIGQVGIRCVYCKKLEPQSRPSGCLAFPDSVASIYTKVSDMIRLHFPSCPAMPDDVKETFRSMKGFGAKAADDSQQYWVDAARDIGLSNQPPDGGWGVTFRRDPLQPSPSDDLDRERATGVVPTLRKSCLVRSEDREYCTDQVMLLMRQVKACTFQKRDRRGGPGARSRDRVIGFPGLCCKWCATKNNVGRYFPLSAKNLTDNTANSMQSHISACSRCPENIKASLGFLSHRSILQKAELSGSWKKAFFKKIWDRLHVERAWVEEEDDDDGVDEAVSGNAIDEEGENDDTPDSVKAKNEDGAGGDQESLGHGMNALIKAAAIWLTKGDQANELPRAAPRSRSRTATNNPASGAKRATSSSTPSKGRGSSLTSAKRRRVHF